MTHELRILADRPTEEMENCNIKYKFLTFKPNTTIKRRIVSWRIIDTINEL